MWKGIGCGVGGEMGCGGAHLLEGFVGGLCANLCGV